MVWAVLRPPRDSAGRSGRPATVRLERGLSRPSLPCRYPHDVVNHLSCDEARNHYGGVVSLIPVVLDLMKEWIAHSEKLPRRALQHVSEPQERQDSTTRPALPSQAEGARPRLRTHQCRPLPEDSPKPRGRDQGCAKPPWRPPGGKL